jgi:hypothetical protein
MLLNICYKKVLTGFLFFISLFVISISCDSTEPTDELKPGRRDYVWTVDTLNIPFTTLQRIWGSSPSDVWTIGPGGDLDKTIYHFDGISWSNDGISRPLSPTSIFGFSNSEVWIGGRGGNIWLFDGFDWRSHTQIIIPGFNEIGLEDIWGETSNNIFAAGYSANGSTYKSCVVWFNGTDWKTLGDTLNEQSVVKVRKGWKTGSELFLLTIKFGQYSSDSMYIYDYSNNKFNLKYKSTSTQIESISDEIYFIDNNRILKFNSNGNTENIVTINSQSFGRAFWGRTRKDIFFRMTDGITHFNGNDLVYLLNFESSISISGCIIFEKEIFFLAYDFNKSLNLIIRGKFF